MQPTQPTPQPKPRHQDHHPNPLAPNMYLHTSPHSLSLSFDHNWDETCAFLVPDLEDAEEHAADGEEEDEGGGHDDAVGDVCFCAE